MRWKERGLLSRPLDRYHSKGILADAPLARQDGEVLCNEAAGEKGSMRKQLATQRGWKRWWTSNHERSEGRGLSVASLAFPQHWGTWDIGTRKSNAMRTDSNEI